MEEAKRGDLISVQIKDLEAARQMHKDVQQQEKDLNEKLIKVRKQARSARRDHEDAIEDGATEEEKNELENKLKMAQREEARIRRALVRLDEKRSMLRVSYYPEHKLSSDLPERSLKTFDDLKKLPTVSNHPVFQAVDHSVEPSRQVILKEFTLSHHEENSELLQFKTEVGILKRLAEYEGVVELISVFRHKHHTYIEMPRYAYGSLLDWKKERSPDVGLVSRAAYRLAHALERIHMAGVIHCDI